MQILTVRRIISGGQTGADQGGLFAARDLGMSTGGTAPLGYRTEEGPAKWLKHYGLTESYSAGYTRRTLDNVLNSGGTVVFGIRSPGSELTISTCISRLKPHLQFIDTFDKDTFKQWIQTHHIAVLNVAGNRESVNPGICEKVRKFLVGCQG